MFARQFDDEEAEEEKAEEKQDSGAEPEYTFEGFNIEFSEKIMLSPAASQPALAKKA